MIFAAGCGTRLKPITDTTPKALVSVDGRSLLELVLRKMAWSGIRDIVVNVHHHSQQVIRFLLQNRFPGLNISISDETGKLLDTGGGLKKAASLLAGNEPILLHNVDVLSNISFSELETAFRQSGAMAMLAVKDRPSTRQLVFDEELVLKGWINHQSGESISVGIQPEHPQLLSFSGISIVGPDFPKALPMKGVFGLVPSMLKLAENNTIKAFTKQHQWLDVGKPEALEAAPALTAKYYKKFLG